MASHENNACSWTSLQSSNIHITKTDYHPTNIRRNGQRCPKQVDGNFDSNLKFQMKQTETVNESRDNHQNKNTSSSILAVCGNKIK